MGNRVEDGNRAKNWVVQTSPSWLYSSFLCRASRVIVSSSYLASRRFISLFHPVSSTFFLSATLRKRYFSVCASFCFLSIWLLLVEPRSTFSTYFLPSKGSFLWKGERRRLIFYFTRSCRWKPRFLVFHFNR